MTWLCDLFMKFVFFVVIAVLLALVISRPACAQPLVWDIVPQHHHRCVVHP